MPKATTMQTLYCHDCQKHYRVKTEAISYMQRLYPGTIKPTGGFYSYSGGCFFKTLSRSRRGDDKGE